MSGNRGNSAPMQRYDKMTDAEIDKLMLPLDRDAAIRKMLSPDWQKKRTDKDSLSVAKKRALQEVTCPNPGNNPKCSGIRLVNMGNRKPLLCAPCSRKACKWNGGSRQ